MKHRANPRFWQAYDRLTPTLQALARKNYALWRDNPGHPSLQFKQVGRFWSVQVGLQHRALAAEAADGTLIWFWIGAHEEYDRLIAH